MQKYPDLKKVITTTSRLPRKGEKEGIDYFFTTKKTFKEKINDGDFLEYVEYGGNYYGTDKSALKNAATNNLLWKIDPSMAGKAHEFIQGKYPLIVLYIYCNPEIILKRLKQRGLSKEEIKIRMKQDNDSFKKYKKNYDFIVDNKEGQIESSIDTISSIIEQK
jgi:guanylate kinase